MKATRISTNVLQLTRFGVVNAFLVKEEDGYTLIDTMVKGSGDKLIQAAADAGAPIVRILITHAHDDHVGSLEGLGKSLPDAEVLASRRDAKLMRGDQSIEPGEPDGKLFGRYPKLDVSVDRELVEGDRVGSLEVIEAPGHSPGQIALLDPRDNILFAADAYSNIAGMATTAGPYPGFPLPGFVTWHKPTALLSARKLRDRNPDWITFGHGKTVREPKEAMDKAIARSA